MVGYELHTCVNPKTSKNDHYSYQKLKNIYLQKTSQGGGGGGGVLGWPEKKK